MRYYQGAFGNLLWWRTGSVRNVSAPMAHRDHHLAQEITAARRFRPGSTERGRDMAPLAQTAQVHTKL